MTRPRLRGLRLLAVALALAASACGASDSAGDGSSAPAEAGAPFPVAVEHRYGSTSIESAPERVVTVGYTDHDFALALGVRPVAVREWFGGRPSATWPWAADELGDARPTVLPAGELSFEQIAALRPDLILGIYSGITEEEYEKLSRIAPTVPSTVEHVDYGTPWQEQTLLTGRALGREPQTRRLVDELEARFDRVREQHPEFRQATALFAYREQAGTFGAYSSADPRGRFLRAVGFQPPTRIDELAGDQFFASVSGEQLRLLEADVLVMIDLAKVAADPQELLKDPVFRRLDVVRDGRDVYPAAEPAAALSFSSPLSLPLAIDAIVPQLAEALRR